MIVLNEFSLRNQGHSMVSNIRGRSDELEFELDEVHRNQGDMIGGNIPKRFWALAFNF